MVRLVPGDAGVIFQLQHLLNHGYGIRRTLSLVILVPHGKTILGLARLALLEDVKLTVFRISKIGHGATQKSKQCRVWTSDTKYFLILFRFHVDRPRLPE